MHMFSIYVMESVLKFVNRLNVLIFKMPLYLKIQLIQIPEVLLYKFLFLVVLSVH